MSTFSVSRLVSDHMVLQYGKPVHLWGWADPGDRISADILKEASADREIPERVNGGETVTEADGTWSLVLAPMNPGYERYLIEIRNGKGDLLRIRDVVVGAVWYASGQSNMDLMMQRVADRYPEEIRSCDEPFIRSFKIAEHTDYHGPLAEPQTGTWTVACRDTILEFSASAWFFSRFMKQEIDMPVGYLHASLGGSHVAGWMSRDMLQASTPAAPGGYPEFITEAEKYADDAFLAGQIKKNGEICSSWDAELQRREEELRKKEADGSGDALYEPIRIPCFFRDIPKLSGFIGSLSIRRRFTLTRQMIRDAEAEGTRIRLFLGTMVDRDKTYINGEYVGETGYQYPPRKYEIPVSLLHEGENEVEIRLIVEKGLGRLTPEKDYSIFCEKTNEIVNIYTHEGFLWCVDLAGEWEYRILASMPEAIEDQDFVNWHPTGLYNGMTAPCHAWPIEGILWYQGEADAGICLADGSRMDYTDLLVRMIRGYRQKWNDASLPFLIVQLPNFTVDLTEEESWPEMRRMQEACLSEPGTGMVCAIDLGEDNDLHPHGKEQIGERLARLALSMVYHRDIETSGPVIEKTWQKRGEGPAGEIFHILWIRCAHADGLTIRDAGKGCRISDFVGITRDGRRIPLEMHGIFDESGKIAVRLTNGEDIREVRYLDSNTYHGGLYSNADGLPMAPFRILMDAVPMGENGENS